MTKQTPNDLNVPGKLNPFRLLALSLAALLITVIQVLPAQAQLSELYAFQYNSATTSNYPDGAIPMAELIQGADGNYYTTTNTGGAGTCPGEVEGQIPGCGEVLKVTPHGKLSVLYSFTYDAATSTAPNGWNPEAGLVQQPCCSRRRCLRRTQRHRHGCGLLAIGSAFAGGRGEGGCRGRQGREAHCLR